MNILGVKCFEKLTIQDPVPALICAHMNMFAINLLPKVCFLQGFDLFAYIPVQFGTLFQTGWAHPP